MTNYAAEKLFQRCFGPWHAQSTPGVHSHPAKMGSDPTILHGGAGEWDLVKSTGQVSRDEVLPLGDVAKGGVDVCH